jgi:hypothetical protein
LRKSWIGFRFMLQRNKQISDYNLWYDNDSLFCKNDG